MQVIKTYIAEDGTRFDCEDDCLRYEQSLKAKAFADQALLFDMDGEPLEISDSGFEAAYFIVCKTVAAADFLYENYGSWDNPWDRDGVSEGVWVYWDDDWYRANAILELSDKLRHVMNA